MKERPIIFSSESIQAILEGRKTQTRRVIKPQPEFVWGYGVRIGDNNFTAHVRFQGGHQPDPWIKSPYGAPGDRLWVRETWDSSIHSDGFSEDGSEIVHDCAAYKSTGTFQCGKDDPIAYKRKYKSPIFMPRWASRITLEITDIRVERVQEISEEDCIAEGIRPSFTRGAGLMSRRMYEVPGLIGTYADGQTDVRVCHSAIDGYSELWDSINTKRGYWWKNNPWVWAIEFKRLESDT